jgi:stalled ribosome rescue protein Dom34
MQMKAATWTPTPLTSIPMKTKMTRMTKITTLVIQAAAVDIIAVTVSDRVMRAAAPLNTKRKKKRKRRKKRRMRSFKKSAESTYSQRLISPNANQRSYVLSGKSFDFLSIIDLHHQRLKISSSYLMLGCRAPE